MWAASEAKGLGYGGISAVARATGMGIETIRRGMKEMEPSRPGSAGEGMVSRRRTRRAGGGRKRLTYQDPALVKTLETLVEPTTRGDPMSPLRWTCKSTRCLAEELDRQGHPISHETVAQVLHELGYSLQGNRKTLEGTSHPDRDAQFMHINAQVEAFQRRGQPVISVDTKKKELVGDFKNGGREWRPQGDPVRVRVHDFQDEEKGKAVPYGVYDVAQNRGWVNLGVDHDTAEFAVQSIRQWWRQMGCPAYPQATELLITADGGGSNGSRVRLWKVCLQKLADEIGLRISVCHLPPGTSKWNKIEHRMFCHITKNWRGQPLESLDVIVNLIANTTTKKGLRIQAAIDRRQYPKGIKVEDEQLAQLQIERDPFHGDWNYTVLPRRL
jgi:transposase